MIDSKFYIGVVEDRNDSEQIGRCRVRIIGLHTDSKSMIPTQDLPLATIVHPSTSSGFSGVGMTPKIIEGSTVLVIFADGDDNMQYPIILGTIAGSSQSYYKVVDGDQVPRNPAYGFNDPNGQYPLSGYLNQSDLPKLARNNATPEFNRPTLNTYLFNEPASGMGNNVYPFNQVRQSEAGHFEEWDDTPGNARLNMQHRAGTYREINEQGQRVLKVVTDKYDITIKDDNIFVGGTRRKIVQDSEIDFINGDWDVTVSGNVNIKVVGDVSVKANGNIDMLAGKNITLAAVEDFNVRAGRHFNVGAVGNTEFTTGGNSTTNVAGSNLFNTTGNYTVEASQIHWSPSGGGVSVNKPNIPEVPNIVKPPLVQTIERPLLPSELEYINQLRDEYVYDSELRELGVNYPPPPPADSDGQYFMAQNATGLGTWSALNNFLSARFDESQAGMWRETGSNSLILNCYKEVGFRITTDAVPWCAAFAGYVLKSSGFNFIAAPKSGLSSLAYRNYGQSVDITRPELWRKWDVIVFTRKGGGHIGFIFGVNKAQNRVLVLGGNQSDSLRLSSFPISGNRFPIAYIGRAWAPPSDQVFTTASVATTTRVV